MARGLFKLSAGIAMMSITIPGWTENRTRCSDKGPPRIWAVKSPYPFQAGSEATFDELYHGQWRARVDIPLYQEPRSRQVAGMVKKGTVVNALLGETIVVHPLRFVASQDFKVSTGFVGQKYELLTMRKGDVFWVLQSEGEGGFAIWWRCSVVGWDSTDAAVGGENRFELLGSNEEGWVEVLNPETGLSGWFKDYLVEDGPKLIPAEATTKRPGAF
jgi:hypothetical protein